jgi:hypothetical protein
MPEAASKGGSSSQRPDFRDSTRESSVKTHLGATRKGAKLCPERGDSWKLTSSLHGFQPAGQERSTLVAAGHGQLVLIDRPELGMVVERDEFPGPQA